MGGYGSSVLPSWLRAGCRLALVLAPTTLALACGKLEEAGAGPAPSTDTPSTPRFVEETWTAEPVAPDPSRREVTTVPSCAGLPGTDEELALTPRADVEAEVLALRVAGTFTADTPTYERIRRDLASIRTRVPALENVRGRSYSGNVGLIVDPSTFDAVEAGTYTAWDCLHARYGWTAQRTTETTRWQIVSGTVVGRFDMTVIAGLYGQLPGVTRTTLSGFIDGSSVCVDREPDGTYHYVFDEASGDCPSGCTAHHRYYFVSDADDRITAKDEHAGGPGPRPDWVTRYGRDAHCY